MFGLLHRTVAKVENKLGGRQDNFAAVYSHAAGSNCEVRVTDDMEIVVHGRGVERVAQYARRKGLDVDVYGEYASIR